MLNSRIKGGVKDPGDAFAVRYALIQIVESLAILAVKLAEAHGTIIEGYIEAMRFLARIRIIDPEIGEKLIRFARLRNLLVHRYCIVGDERIIREARENGVKTVEEAVENVKRLLA